MTRLLTSTFSLLSAAALMLGAPQMAAAQSASALSGLYACEGISDISTQLACFRAETAKLRAADPSVSSNGFTQAAPAAPSAPVVIERKSLASVPAAPSAPAAPFVPAAPAPVKSAAITPKEIVPQPQAQEPSRKTPEFTPLKKEKTKAEKKRSLAIVSTKVYDRRSGYIRFFLENGEVWQQTQSGRVRLGKTDGPDILALSGGALGSSFAKVNGKGTAIRVKRIR